LGLSATHLDTISPWRFKAPLAPDMAASQEGRALDFLALVSFSRNAIAEAQDVLLIEGVGGIMVPLDECHTVLDWMAALRVPLILAAGSYLGTISHTLSALDVLARRDLQVAAVVVSESPNSTVPLDDTAHAIARFCRDKTAVLALPRVTPGERHPVFAELARLV
jgi:dethiobiotin synthetase